jgi:hypothetical protein
MLLMLSRSGLTPGSRFQRWVQKEIDPTQKRAVLPFDKVDVLAECLGKTDLTTPVEVKEQLSKKIALNASVKAITQAIYDPTMTEPVARDEVLLWALYLRVNAHNKAYQKASKWGSIGAAYMARFAVLGLVGDTIGHLAKFIDGQTDNWFSFSMKLLVGAAVTFYTAKKLIPVVTHHVMRNHSETLIDKITESVRFSASVPAYTARRIYEYVHTSCPHLPNLYELTGKAKEVPLN